MQQRHKIGIKIDEGKLTTSVLRTVYAEILHLSLRIPGLTPLGSPRSDFCRTRQFYNPPPLADTQSPRILKPVHWQRANISDGLISVRRPSRFGGLGKIFSLCHTESLPIAVLTELGSNEFHQHAECDDGACRVIATSTGKMPVSPGRANIRRAWRL